MLGRVSAVDKGGNRLEGTDFRLRTTDADRKRRRNRLEDVIHLRIETDRLV